MEILTLIFSLAYFIIIITTVILIITENSNSSKTVAWILVLIIIPLLGMVLYYVFGYSPRRNDEYQKNYERFINDISLKVSSGSYLSSLVDNIDYKDKVAPEYTTLVNLLQHNNNSKVLLGSDIEIIISGHRKFEALICDIENAEHHIHMEYFYFRRDPYSRKIRELLMKKASEGVSVRFIYENIANIDISPRYYLKMREAGVEVLPFTKSSLPWIRRNLNYRDHRKIVVIDGNIGYTGGMNIGDDYFVKWRDTHLRIKGQGGYGLQINFLHAWHNSKGSIPADLERYFPVMEQYSDNLMQVVPEAPDSKWPYLLMANINALVNAKRYIYIQTPYYMPSDSLLQALKSAALSGVDVRVMVSRKSDLFFMDFATHSFYADSLEAGIRIYEIQDKFNHAKTMVIDDYLSIVGSANLDVRSLELSFEINAYMYDPLIAKQNYDIFFEDMKTCKEVLLDEWLKRPWYKKFIQSVMRLLSPLL